MEELVTKELNRIASMDKSKEGDYTENGILYCGKCHEAKTAWIDWIPDKDGRQQKRLVPVMCRCDLEEEQREKKRQAELRYKEAFTHFQLAINGQQKVDKVCSLENDEAPNSAVSRVCRAYIEQWQEMRKSNMGILFYGSSGTGKTFYASAIANELNKQHIVAIVSTTANLMSVLSATFDKTETIEAVSRVPMLVLDDLGAERDTSYSAELLYNVVNSRYNAHLPTIVTTNYDLEQMRKECDLWRSRIYDRIIEMCPITIKMEGESKRTAIADERKRKARELLLGVKQ